MKEQFKASRRCRTANVSQNMGAVPTQIITDDSLLNISAIPKQTALTTETRGHCSLSAMCRFSSWSARDFRQENWKIKQRGRVNVRTDSVGKLSVVPSGVSATSHCSPCLSSVTKKSESHTKSYTEDNGNSVQVRTEWDLQARDEDKLEKSKGNEKLIVSLALKYIWNICFSGVCISMHNSASLTETCIQLGCFSAYSSVEIHC